MRRYGIDYYLVGGHAFYAQQEIYDLLNLLRTLDSPCDEVSLAGVLRSPMFSLHDETLFWLLQPIGQDGRDSPRLLDGAELPEEIEGQQRAAAEFAAATLRDLRAMKDRLPVAQLIQEALRADRLRRPAAGRVPRRAETGQSAQAGRAGAEFRPGGHLHALRLHHPACRVRRPAARRAAGRHLPGIGRRGEADDDPSGEGAWSFRW